nr:MAG TPA: hypothetical protein [Caudoviricetes sp.]
MQSALPDLCHLLLPVFLPIESPPFLRNPMYHNIRFNIFSQ